MLIGPGVIYPGIDRIPREKGGSRPTSSAGDSRLTGVLNHCATLDMLSPNQQELERRVLRAAEAALSRQQYVSAIDVLCGMGLLASAQVDSWRKGRVDFLERVIQGNLKKISLSMATFRRWAREKGLKPSETQYMRHSRTGTVVLQFSKSGDPGIDKSSRTHFVSPQLSENKEQRLQ